MGRGYATEAAQAALAHGHGHGPLDVPEIIAFTVPDNVPSRRVMEKTGMRHDPADDFDHPALADGYPAKRHVLYRSSRRV